MLPSSDLLSKSLYYVRFLYQQWVYHVYVLANPFQDIFQGFVVPQFPSSNIRERIGFPGSNTEHLVWRIHIIDYSQHLFILMFV